ncbi:hypothetical protein LZ31DRAFT_271977 [Colletotrichum somersetense]|nr:hypothetical protein LZ31DRAFT_271977 [Colletotrichum somersetense]
MREPSICALATLVVSSVRVCRPDRDETGQGDGISKPHGIKPQPVFPCKQPHSNVPCQSWRGFFLSLSARLSATLESRQRTDLVLDVARRHEHPLPASLLKGKHKNDTKSGQKVKSQKSRRFWADKGQSGSLVGVVLWPFAQRGNVI